MAIDDFKSTNQYSKEFYPEELKDELTFNFNDFNEPQVEEKIHALSRLVLNLLLTVPGTYPDTPNMGINIAQYQFEFLDNNLIQTIQRHVKEQVDTYIPNNNIQKIIVAKSNVQNNVLIVGFSMYIDIPNNKTQNAFIMIDQDLNSFIKYSD